MMKSLLHLSMVLAAGMLLTQSANAQGIGINETGADPHPSSGLDVSSSTKGFLPPRLTTAQRDAIVSPATGLTIYNTTTNCENYFNSTNWVELCENVAFSPIVATGGTITEYTANGTNGVNGVIYRVHSFTTLGNSSFNVTDPGTDGQVEYLVVGGGGGGGTGTGGGGGGGGCLSGNITLSSSVSVVVGSGGSGGTINVGQNGGNSSLGNLIAIGGGYGAKNTVGGGYISAVSGGSGGGGSEGNLGASGTFGQGNNGGAATSWNHPYYGAGGGGGAGTPGGNGDANNPGNGGSGIQSTITGTALFYGGGGGGGSYNNGPLGTGGIGGGGNAPAGNGLTNTGGGGAGQTNNSTIQAGNGGSGIVIIRYPITNP